MMLKNDIYNFTGKGTFPSYTDYSTLQISIAQGSKFAIVTEQGTSNPFNVKGIVQRGYYLVVDENPAILKVSHVRDNKIYLEETYSGTSLTGEPLWVIERSNYSVISGVAKVGEGETESVIINYVPFDNTESFVFDNSSKAGFIGTVDPIYYDTTPGSSIHISYQLAK